MLNTLQTKTKILLFVSLGVLFFIVALIGNIYFENKEVLENKEKSYKEIVTRAYYNILRENNNKLQSRLQGILITHGVIDAIKNKDRTRLYNIVLPKWNLLRKEDKNITILHFHQANGQTLLRVHDPKKYGDNIAQKRAMVSFMHKYRKKIEAYEAGVYLLGYRIMLPIFDDTNYLGAIEIGINPSFVLEHLNNIYHIRSAIFTKKADIFKGTKSANEIFTIGDYKLASDDVRIKKLVKNFPSDYQFTEDTRITSDEEIYDIFVIDHKDFKGEVGTKVLIFYDVTTLYAKLDSTVRSIIIYSIAFYLFLIVIIKFGFEKLLDRFDATYRSLKKSNKELQKNLAVLNSHQLAMDESSIVTKSDLQGKITYANENFCKITGYTQSEIIGKPHSIVRHSSTPQKTFQDIWETIQNKKVWKGTLLNRGKFSDYWVDVAILPILDEKSEISEYIAVRHDITQRVQQEEILNNIANTDQLTGFWNRYKLMKDIQKSTNPALAILNVDSFSEINDFYGHTKGDMAIKKLGDIIFKAINKEICKLYHLQGDEYVVFSSNITRENFIQHIESMLQQIKNSPLKLDEESIHLSFSSAISFEKKNEILMTADMALKVAKRTQKELIIYSQKISLNAEYENNLKWAKKIKTAIEEDKFIPVFQPIVHNTNNKWNKYECLVRMTDEGKLVSPYLFLDIAKRTKHYSEITKIMIKKSFEYFKTTDLSFSLNVTVEDILNKDIQEYIITMLEEYQIGSRVIFEIVESESIENFSKVYEFITKVKAYGCKIAIDDFGTGYSNFEYLVQLKADYIKIDGSLIKGINTNTTSQIVVKNIVNFAKDLNMETVAEFVENEEIFNKAKELGIDYSQGYYFSEPKIIV